MRTNVKKLTSQRRTSTKYRTPLQLGHLILPRSVTVCTQDIMWHEDLMVTKFYYIERYFTELLGLIVIKAHVRALLKSYHSTRLATCVQSFSTAYLLIAVVHKCDNCTIHDWH